MKLYNVLDYDENVIISNLTIEQAFEFCTCNDGLFLIGEMLTDED